MFMRLESEDGIVILNTDMIAQVRPSALGKSDFPTTVITNQFVPHIRIKTPIGEFCRMLESERRDQFAGQAMQGMMANSHDEDREGQLPMSIHESLAVFTAMTAYEVADAMLAERQRETPK